eukprot:36843-Hanusia_phi.AAC.1
MPCGISGGQPDAFLAPPGYGDLSYQQGQRMQELPCLYGNVFGGQPAGMHYGAFTAAPPAMGQQDLTWGGGMTRWGQSMDPFLHG